MNLARFKQKVSTALSLADLLNYGHLLAEEGAVLLKDGAFLVSYYYQAPDLDSATQEECDALVQLFNRMLLLFGDGWMIHVDEIRTPSTTYPQEGHFPDEVSWLIDQERRALYLQEGTHFENTYVLTFVWKFPLRIANKTRYLFLKGLEAAKEVDLNHLLKGFLETVERAVLLLQNALKLTKLSPKALLSYLEFCIQGSLNEVAPPPLGLYLDVALAQKSLRGGFRPQIGDKFI